MIYRHQHFQLDTETKKVFDEDGKELVLVGNSYRVLVFLCANKNATLTQIGDFLDWAKEYTENHLRQYRYKINTIIGNTIVEYRNNIYSLVGEVENADEIKKNDRITDLLQYDHVKSKAISMDNPKEIKFTKWPALFASGLLLLSFLTWPYAYYTFLRIGITGVAIYYAYYLYSIKRQGFWFWGFVVIAVLFNPIVPIYLKDKSIWVILDVATAIYFIISLFIRKK